MDDFVDKDLGPVVVKRNSRSKKVIARRKHNCVEMTVPRRLTQSEIKKHFDNLKPRILMLPIKEVVKITEESNIKTYTFDVVITRQSLFEDKVSMKLRDGITTIDIPAQYDINKEYVQKAIKDVLIHALRDEAKRVLPIKVMAYAKKYGFTVREIKINNSKNRWGSCTGRKNINLSLFLMMLPEHLINYVILHELAHTIELNHGQRFWQILDQLCEGKAAQLNDECSNFDSSYSYSMKQ